MPTSFFTIGRILRALFFFLLATGTGILTRAQAPNTCDLFTLDAPVPQFRSFYGYRTSVSERFAIVGAGANVVDSIVGKAHIYEQVGGAWVHRQTLSAPGTRAIDAYASHVYIDENTALVAANNYRSPRTSNTHVGAIYVYTRQGSQWVQTGFIANPSATVDGFGWSIAKSGSDVIVGCTYNGTQNHPVFVFHQPAVPTQPWTLAATLLPTGANIGYDFGHALAIDGDNIVIGAPNAVAANTQSLASVYFYHRTAGVWSLTQTQSYPRFSAVGNGVAVYGNYAVLCSDPGTGPTSFNAEVYEQVGTGWQLKQTLLNPDYPSYGYGAAVALNAGVLLLTSPSSGANNQARKLYRYELRNGSWQLRRRYQAPVGQPNLTDGFANWVAIDAKSNNFITGAVGRTSLGVAQGGQAFVQWNPAIAPAGPFCADAAAVQLQATTTGGTWSGPGITNAQTGVFAPAQAGPGSHSIAYTLAAGGCTFRDTVVITVKPALHINRPNLAVLSCARDTTLTLTANVGGGTWSGAGITNGQAGTFRTWVAGPGHHVLTYRLATTTLCTAQDTFSIVVRPAPVHAVPIGRRLTCARDTSLTLVATPAGGTWQGQGITSSTSGTFSTATAGSGRHVLTYSVGGAGPCAGHDTLSLVVQPLVVRVLTAPATFCRLDTVLQLAATPSGGTWRGTGITNGQQGLFSTAIAGSGRHVLRYEVGTGACRAADSVAVVINPISTPVLTPAGPLTLRCGQPSEALSIQGAMAATTRYEWQYAPTTNAAWQPLGLATGQLSYQATQGGWYRVRATQGSCVALSKAIEVRSEPVEDVFIPNVFTPNHDGLNEVFTLKLQYPRTFRLQVFNRWGHEVFATTTYGDFWTGAGVPEGIYYYVWRYSTECEPAEHLVKGWVSVIP